MTFLYDLSFFVGFVSGFLSKPEISPFAKILVLAVLVAAVVGFWTMGRKAFQKFATVEV